MTALVLAGTTIPRADDLVRRYTGLPWSRGRDETWAWRYYDSIPDEAPDILQPIDVLAATALGPGPAPADLVWFWQQRTELQDFLATVPVGADLADATAPVQEQVRRLALIVEGTPVTLSLLSKVLHRKRPALVPLLDKAVLSLYRSRLPQRSGPAAWPSLVDALRADLATNHDTLTQMTDELARLLPTPPSPLRIIDISIWMAAQNPESR